jgi:saxitoxin biosynthesis operon SxtJ-like protein
MSSPFKPNDRMLRQFAGLWILFFAWISWRAYANDRDVLAAILAFLAFTVGPLGAIWPAFIRPVFVAWMTLAFPIGWTISRIVLGALFYGLFTPIAFVFRWIGRDELVLHRQPQTRSYWCGKPAVTDKVRYLRQY